MLKKFYILFAITIVITACSKNADPSSPDLAPDRSDSGISFTFTKPAGSYIQTYADGTANFTLFPKPLLVINAE